MADNEELSISIKTKAEQAQKSLLEVAKTLGYTANQIKFIQTVAGEGKAARAIATIQSGVNKINLQVSETGKILKHTEKISMNTKKSMSSMFDSGKLYLYWNLTKRVRDTIGGWITSAIDFQETTNLFNVSMGTSVNQATRFQNKLAEIYGTARTELMKYQSTFKNILSGLGDLSTETTEKISETLTRMGLDYSSLYNISQASAMERFQSALTGSIRPIRSTSGYDVSDLTIAAKAQGLGVDKTSKELTQMEKRILRIIVLMEQMSRTGAMNDLARTIESPANQIKVLKNQVQELGVWLGNVFMGTIGAILPYINGFVMVLKELVKTFAIFVGYSGDSNNLGDVFETVEDTVGGIAGGLGSAAKAAKEMRRVLMGFDVLNVITTPKDPKGGGGGGSGVGAIDPKILNALKEYDSVMDNVRMKAVDIRDKIMDWLGFTKIIDPLTGEIGWKLRDGFQNIEKIGLILKTIIGIILGVKIYKGLVALWGVLKTIMASKILIWAKNFGTALFGIATGSTAAKSALTFMLVPVGKATAAVGAFFTKYGKLIGVIGLFITAISGAISLWKEYGKALETGNLSIGKTVTSVTTLVGGLAGIGAILGGPIGATVGALIGMATAVMEVKAQTDAFYEEVARKNVFGTLSISTERWKEQLKQLDGINLQDIAGTLQTNLDTIKDEFDTASAKVEGFGIRFGIMGQKITNEDMKNITDSVEKMCDSTISMIDANTDAQIKLWTQTYKTIGGVTKEEQKDWLNTIMNYGNKQKTEIEAAQSNVTTTYENAIKTRGYLTDEEYNYIQEQLAKIRELTQQNMSQSNTDMLYLKNQYIDESSRIDEESYNAFNKALQEYKQEQLDILSKNYNIQLIGLENLHKNGEISEANYNKKLAEINQSRKTETEKLNSEIQESYQLMYTRVALEYDKLKGSTDKTSEEMRKIYEKLFTDAGLDIDEFVKKARENAGTAGQSWKSGFLEGSAISAENILPSSTFSTLGYNASTRFWNNFRGGNITQRTNSSGSIEMGITPRADGGIVPPGELFLSREAGPEFVGRIGNQTAVMNNDQIVESVSKGVAQAVSAVMGTGGASYNLYLDGKQLTDVVQERIYRNAIIAGA